MIIPSCANCILPPISHLENHYFYHERLTMQDMQIVENGKIAIKDPSRVTNFAKRKLGQLYGPIESSIWDVGRDVDSAPGFITHGKLMQWRTGFSDRVIGKADPPNSLSDIPKPGRGWANMGKPFDTTTIESLASKFDETVRDDRFTNPIVDPEELPEGYKHRVLIRSLNQGISEETEVSFFECFPELYKVIETAREPVKTYYGCDFRLTNGSIRRTYHIPKEVVEQTEVYSNYWHIDNHPIDQLKLFIALSDIDENDGPFHYLSYEDSQRLLKQSYDRQESGVPGEFVEEQADINTFTGEKGSAMLCNTNVILHRAGNPSPENNRDLLTLQLSPISETCALDWDEQINWDMIWGTDQLKKRLRW